MKMYLKNKINYINIIIIIFLLDQFSKLFIYFNPSKFISKDFYIFTIDIVKNNGAAFNILSGNRFFLSIISIITSIILTYYIFIVDSKNLNSYGLSFILGGCIGNGIDRIFNGYVIDFIRLKFIDFPIFNIADIAINIGVLFIVISYLRYKS